jgi:tetratricopeptide (TPR) repeat protein
MRSIIVGLVIVCANFSHVAEELGVGDKCIIVGNASVRERPTDTAPPVRTMSTGIVSIVQETHGDWLRISDGSPGWVRRQEAVSTKRGADRFNELLRADPENTEWLFGRGVALEANGEHAKAIEDFSEVIRRTPKHFAAWNARGLARHSQGDFDRAIEDFGEGLRSKPRYSILYTNRGRSWNAKGDHKKAIADYDEALRLQPEDSFALSNRASAWKASGELQKAIDDWTEAIRIDPKHSVALNNLAWLRATTKDDRFRDGAAAVRDATLACEYTGWKIATPISTLAAAYAESGDFEKAVGYCEQAVKLMSKEKLPAEQERLELYRSRKPFRDSPNMK